jgi:hypothetical protein
MPIESQNNSVTIRLLHGVAHAYHDQVLGYDVSDIRKTYERAKPSRTYDEVLRGDDLCNE